MKKTRFWMLAVLFTTFVIICTAMVLSYYQNVTRTFIQDHDAIIIYDKQCSDCSDYVKNIMKPTLVKNGITDIVDVDLSTRDGRAIYLDFTTKRSIPTQLKLKPTVSISDRLYLAGYIPNWKLAEILSFKENISGKMFVGCEEKYDPATYNAWDLSGEIREYQIKTPITTYIQWVKSHPGTTSPPEPGVIELLPLVVVGGLLDGINPCAFAVILFLVAILYTYKANSSEVFDIGMIYIITIFVTYFLIGMAIFETLKFIGIQLYILIIAAAAIVLLGIINVRDAVTDNKKPLLKIPERSKGLIHSLAKKATIPAALGLALFVSITEFTCTGAIYLVVITLLSSATTYFTGLALLILYNIMFIIPLLIILLLVSNKKIAGEMKRWREREKKKMRLSLGISMILLGLWSLAMKYSPVAMVIITAGLVIDLAFALLVYMQVKHSIRPSNVKMKLDRKNKKKYK